MSEQDAFLDELFRLAKDDPERFEKYSRQLINDCIISAPPQCRKNFCTCNGKSNVNACDSKEIRYNLPVLFLAECGVRLWI